MKQALIGLLLGASSKWLDLRGVPRHPGGYARVRILKGPNKGRFIASPDQARLSFLTGTYEQGLLDEMMPHARDAVVYVVGAHAGYVAMALSNVAREVHTFEADPKTLEATRWNIEQNDLSNVTLVEKAVCEHEDGVTFATFEYSLVSHVYSEAESLADEADFVSVPSTSIDAYVAAGNAAPDMITSAITVGEPDVMTGATETLRNHRPIVFSLVRLMARDQLETLMTDHGYDIEGASNAAFTFEADDCGELVFTPR